MARKGRNQQSEMVQRIVHLGTARLVRQLGVTEEAAQQTMREFAHELCCEYGGQMFYFPKDNEFALAERDKAIAAEFNGHNVRELGVKYRLSVVQIYSILGHVRRLKAAPVAPEFAGEAL